MLKSSARTFIEREAPPHAIVALQRADSGLVPALWRKASDAGWLGILIPSEDGGGEGSAPGAATAFPEVRPGPAPGPLFNPCGRAGPTGQGASRHVRGRPTPT